VVSSKVAGSERVCRRQDGIQPRISGSSRFIGGGAGPRFETRTVSGSVASALVTLNNTWRGWGGPLSRSSGPIGKKERRLAVTGLTSEKSGARGGRGLER